MSVRLPRRIVLWGLAAALFAAADTRQDVADVAGDLAGALANDDAEAFVQRISKTMPQRSELREMVAALVNGANVTSAVEIIDLKEGEGGHVVANLDWSMRVQAKQPDGPLDQRQETVTIELVREGKKWRVVKLSPMNFFRPQKLTP